jgi:tetratricopeptide (TPR) repeat protein
MKLFLLLFIISSLTAKSQKIPDTLNTRLDLLLKEFQLDTTNQNVKAEIKDINYKIQNTGFDLMELSNDYTNSLKFINKSLSIWVLTGDTINQANNLKFRGLLLAHLNQISEGKEDIFTAIHLFKLKNKNFGVAVSDFDLSKVYELENQLDSSLFFALKAVNYWTDKNNSSRLISINNQLINLYYKLGQYHNALVVQKETEVLFTKTSFWLDRIDFYFLSANLFRKTSNTKLRILYQNLYKEKVSDLGKKGIVAHSQYDNK